VTDGMTVTSYSDSLLPKISAATNRLGQLALYRKLLRKFEKFCKCSSRVDAKSRKRDLPVLCARYRKNRSV